MQYQETGRASMSFPTPNFYLPVDTAAVKTSGHHPQGPRKAARGLAWSGAWASAPSRRKTW
ncbi:MAG: hypothetical protein WKG07_20090 [Hymenobacter sp.]